MLQLQDDICVQSHMYGVNYNSKYSHEYEVNKVLYVCVVKCDLCSL